MNSGIYIIKMEGFNYHKIGRSKNIKERLIRYTEIPFKLEYVLKYPMDRSIMGMVEKHLHTIYKKRRVRGEWFTLYEDDIKKIPKIIDKFIKKNDNEIRKRILEYKDRVPYVQIVDPYKVFLDYKKTHRELKKRTNKYEVTRTVYARENNISDGQLARIIFCGKNNEELFKSLSNKGTSTNEMYKIIRDMVKN